MNGGLIQRCMEEAGISTISLSIFRSVTEMVKPPRVLVRESQRGMTLGPPNNRKLQREIVEGMIRGLREAKRPGEVFEFASASGS
jgi:D-proline reductase (dithiol) PrdB